jgi:hypothetical protein
MLDMSLLLEDYCSLSLWRACSHYYQETISSDDDGHLKDSQILPSACFLINASYHKVSSTKPI